MHRKITTSASSKQHCNVSGPQLNRKRASFFFFPVSLSSQRVSYLYDLEEVSFLGPIWAYSCVRVCSHKCVRQWVCGWTMTLVLIPTSFYSHFDPSPASRVPHDFPLPSRPAFLHTIFHVTSIGQYFPPARPRPDFIFPKIESDIWSCFVISAIILV